MIPWTSGGEKKKRMQEQGKAWGCKVTFINRKDTPPHPNENSHRTIRGAIWGVQLVSGKPNTVRSKCGLRVVLLKQQYVPDPTLILHCLFTQGRNKNG